jgi:hypothetical protein
MKHKTKIEEPKEEVGIPPEGKGSTPEPAPLNINPILENFGREDLHRLRDKINEVIDFINKQ